MIDGDAGSTPSRGHLRVASLDRLDDHVDALVAGMQGPEAAEALAQGFSATPEEMSAAALAAARAFTRSNPAR